MSSVVKLPVRSCNRRSHRERNVRIRSGFLTCAPTVSRELFTFCLAKTEQSRKRKLKAPAGERGGFNRVKQSTEQGVQDASEGRTSSSGGSPLNEVPGEMGGPATAERGLVLKACSVTSAGLALAGFLVRQVSHTAAENGWPVPDCTVLMPYKTELWHLVPTVGVVVLVASLRQILLQLWPNFAQSSQAANNQVLGSLEPLDFLTVSCLSGTSEELLFRGALLPSLGADWRGVSGAGLVFGLLHLSGGRNASFAVWASIVGVAYGILGLHTHDLAAPMAAHSLANLLGAAIWKISQNLDKSK